VFTVQHLAAKHDRHTVSILLQPRPPASRHAHCDKKQLESQVLSALTTLGIRKSDLDNLRSTEDKFCKNMEHCVPSTIDR